jgi:hypothetical protein
MFLGPCYEGQHQACLIPTTRILVEDAPQRVIGVIPQLEKK